MAATPNWALWGVSHWPRQDNNSKCNHAWNWNERVQISIHSQQIQIHSRDKSKQSPVTAPTAEDFTLPLLGMGGREGKIRKARCCRVHSRAAWSQKKRLSGEKVLKVWKENLEMARICISRRREILLPAPIVLLLLLLSTQGDPPCLSAQIRRPQKDAKDEVNLKLKGPYTSRMENKTQYGKTRKREA